MSLRQVFPLVVLWSATSSAQQFAPASPQGFGDRQNSWAWSMAWFQGKLYVGTMRSYWCVSAAAISRIFPSAYPPADPDIECTPDSKDLPLEAEIWAWSPGPRTWALVYRSPRNVPIPGTSKFTAPDIGFRGMHVFREASGVEALYAGGCSARSIYPGLAGGRLLRSVDGVTFSPVPQSPGTFLGNLQNACFRGMGTHGGKFYAVAGTFGGAGAVIESANPELGGNSFQQITPAGAEAYEFSSFNGSLYISFDHPQGFQLYKTPTTGSLPYTFTPVMTGGGYGNPRGNPSALSMKAFRGSLYVGGNSVSPWSGILCAIPFNCVMSLLRDGGAELFRVNADDSWDLIVGQSRATPIGQKNALSGIGAGFGWPLNQHLWRMEVFDNRLYVGTYDVATELRNAGSGIGTAVSPYAGFDLWQSTDGVRFTPIDIRGFGDKFDYGVRSLLAAPPGLFLGTANPYYGTRVYLATPPTPAGATQ